MTDPAIARLDCMACGRTIPFPVYRGIREGWPSCCGHTMRVLASKADLREAVRRLYP